MDQPEFRVLGPVGVYRAGRPVRLAGKALTVLAGLLLSANDTVSADSIAEWVWAGNLPAHPRAALHNTLSRLRYCLGPGVIETVAGGYLLVTDAEHLDLLRFRRLVTSAAASLGNGRTEDAADLLGEAVGLWREPLLANVDSPALTHDVTARLTEQYLSTHETRARVCLGLGRYGDVADALSPIVRAHPFREALAECLMLGLLASGRRAEALAVYHAVRAALRDELGIDPGQNLRELHLQILQESPLPANGRAPGHLAGLSQIREVV